ncbi:lytic transglycosylase domain-containing protein [Erythrobacter sp. MTPC3]|uniref:lytic transglycosylase domain-containing protein n=1 Tax=Erythrobacter sp. MTPC3 TaxID=3056564 RepID=UPI0036F32615
MLRLYLLQGLLATMWAASPAQVFAQSPQPIRLSPHVEIAAHVSEASQQFGIPEHWIYAVIRVESAGRVRAVSSAGAMGLMQLMPGTWARQRDRFSLGQDPFDPRDNVLAGTSYLREMYDRYGAQGFLAAYNAGPGRYEDWLAGRRSLPLETRRYVARIAQLLQSERIFAAAPLQTRNAPAGVLPPSGAARQELNEVVTAGPAANPFARPEQPAHDLFAPVSTASSR